MEGSGLLAQEFAGACTVQECGVKDGLRAYLHSFFPM